MGQNAADADPFISDPSDPVLAHATVPDLAVRRENAPLRILARHARVMQRDHFPLIVEDGRTG
jgi:hypothetical protein